MVNNNEITTCTHPGCDRPWVVEYAGDKLCIRHRNAILDGCEYCGSTTGTPVENGELCTECVRAYRGGY